MSFIGLAGVGDLIATSHSEYSRNHKFGYRVATSRKPAVEIIEDMDEVVEGISTLNAVYSKTLELKVDMPILKALHQIVHGKKNINFAISKLLMKASVENLDITEMLEKELDPYA